jgi:hypothetical protein
MLPVENVVPTLQRAMHFQARGVRRKLRHIRGYFFRQEKLSGMRRVSAQMNFQADVYGAAEIPARIDGGEFGGAVTAR